MRVLGIGFFSTSCGYDTHTRNFFSNLSKFVELETCELTLSTDFSSAVVKKHASNYQADVAITIVPPNQTKLIMNSIGKYCKKRIGVAIFESETLAQREIDGMNDLEEIWVPSTWGQKVLKSHGLSSYVVPEGVNTDVFRPCLPPLSNIYSPNGFKFLCVSNDYPRKNLDLLFQAFHEEFKNEDVNLFWLRSWNHNEKRIIPEKVVMVPHIPDYKLVANLYNSVHAFVLPTKGEGWGLPILEAMSCGLPVITTNYGPTNDFASDKTAYLIDNQVKNGQAEVDIVHLKKLMRHVKENYQEARQIGQNASVAACHWTWENAARIALNRIL